jgi:hypothetical protein
MRGGQFAAPSLWQQIVSFFTRYLCYIVAALAVVFLILYVMKPTQVVSPVKEKMCGSCPKSGTGLAFSN